MNKCGDCKYFCGNNKYAICNLFVVEFTPKRGKPKIMERPICPKFESKKDKEREAE